MTRQPSTSAVQRLLQPERDAAERRLESVLDSLPPPKRQQAAQAVCELSQLDWIARLTDLIIWIARGKDAREALADESATSPSLVGNVPLGSARPPTTEAAIWSEVARMIGTAEVDAGAVREMAAMAGAELSHAQAARKLQNWTTTRVMERVGRGVFTFSDRGLQRYRISEHEEKIS